MRVSVLALALLAAAPAFAQVTTAPASSRVTILDPSGNDRVVIFRPPPRDETKAESPADDHVVARRARIERPVFIPPQRRGVEKPAVSDRGESIVPPMFDTFTPRATRPAFVPRHNFGHPPAVVVVIGRPAMHSTGSSMGMGRR